MLEYNRIDIFEGIDTNKTNKSKECKFAIIGTLKILVLNMNHIFVMVVMVYCKKLLVLIKIAILYVKGSAYKINFWYISKDDVINIMNNSSLVDKMGVL